MSYQYPIAPKPMYPYDISANWKNIITAFDSGKEQRRQKQLYAKYDVKLTYERLTPTDIQLLWNFYQARRGSFEAFYFYTLETATWDNLYIGTGDGVTTTFDLPGKTTSAEVVYAGGIIIAAADYTINVGAGDCSADQIVFDTAPVANALLTCDFYGYMRIRCRFKDDNLSRSNFKYILYSTGINLKGLANA